METFKKELEKLINKYSLENISNTPDFILAEYLIDCLTIYAKVHNTNEKWYGKKLKIKKSAGAKIIKTLMIEKR